MMRTISYIIFFVVLTFSSTMKAIDNNVNGYIDASFYGFSPKASGVDNAKALQKAVDQGGTITVNQPGTYKIASTVFIGDNTSLVFGNGVYLEKSAEKKVFSHVFLNKGALTRTYNHKINT